ncbi:hypothetical protein OC835_007591 [Tilletia horrida]|nr:hypothetical protein OC835_007591 [Tilletia horrida]
MPTLNTYIVSLLFTQLSAGVQADAPAQVPAASPVPQSGQNPQTEKGAKNHSKMKTNPSPSGAAGSSTAEQKSSSPNKTKVRKLIDQVTEVERFLNETGQGLMADAREKGEEAEKLQETSLMAAVRKICPYYDVLLPVLKDRASVNPAFSHSTGDQDDPALAFLRMRCARGGTAVDNEEQEEEEDDEEDCSGAAKEEFYQGWEDDSQDQTANGEGQ